MRVEIVENSKADWARIAQRAATSAADVSGAYSELGITAHNMLFFGTALARRGLESGMSAACGRSGRRGPWAR